MPWCGVSFPVIFQDQSCLYYVTIEIASQEEKGYVRTQLKDRSKRSHLLSLKPTWRQILKSKHMWSMMKYCIIKGPLLTNFPTSINNACFHPAK